MKRDWILEPWVNRLVSLLFGLGMAVVVAFFLWLMVAWTGTA